MWRVERFKRRLRCLIRGHEIMGAQFVFGGWCECMCCGRRWSS